MSNDFYNPSGSPGTRSAGSSSVQRAEFTSIAAGFSKLAPLAALFFVRTNSAGTAQESISPSAARTAMGAVGTADANVFTANQTIEKSLPVFLLKDTDTTLTDGQEVATLNVEQSDASAPGLSAKIAAIADGVAGKLKWVFSVGLPSALANVLTINDGGVVVDGTLDVSGNLSMSGAINEARASVTGHATDTPIWAAAGNAVEITGTPTITDFPDAPQAGSVRRIFPAAGTVITNNANISVQGGADYTFAAGDWCLIEAITTATFRATVFRASGASGRQAGEIFIHSGTTAPTGALALPTAPTNISRTTYAKLFAAIGTTWGAGDGSTTFGMPYLPSNQVPVQANANVGTSTVGENLAHTHAFVRPLLNVDGGGGGWVGGGSFDGSVSYVTDAAGGTFNLPAGVRVLYCVQYQ